MRRINSGHMNSARMGTVTTVTFIVAFAPLLWGLAEVKGPATGDCSKNPKTPQVVSVDTAPTTVTLNCGESNENNVKPEFSKEKFEVCTKEDCSEQQQLSEYIKRATSEVVNKTTAKVTIEDLPSEAKTFYIQCEGKKDNACYIQVEVAEAPDKPVEDGNGQSGVTGGGTGSTGGVTPGSPLSCATPGGAITIKIPEKGSTAQFTCGSWTLYPLAADRVLAENCKKEESLKDIVRSANTKVYTLTAARKPPKKKWCYLCASSDVTSQEPGAASDYCVVHVESSSRTQSSSATALAAVLSCFLAVLRIT